MTQLQKTDFEEKGVTANVEVDYIEDAGHHIYADQYESLQDEAKSANDQVNSLTQRLAQNASR